MMRKIKTSESTETLRTRAERQAGKDPLKQAEMLSPEQAQTMLHELRVHQIELETQNEELRRTQKELEASRERYFGLYDLAPVGYVTLNEQGEILEANLTAATLLGTTRGELTRRPLTHFLLFADHPRFSKHTARLFKKGETQVFELKMVKQDGTQFWARLEAIAVTGEDGTRGCWTAISNITKQKLAEDALQEAFNETEQKVELRTRELNDANRTLRTLKECYEARARAGTEAELLHDICRIMVEIGGAKLAWVGYPEQDEAKRVRITACAGDVDDYLNKIRVTWANDVHGRGPVGTSIRTGTVNVCRDTATDPRVAPWREQQLQRGYTAMVALPLMGEGHLFGVLTIYSGHANAFSEEEVKLLKQLAGDLAFGIIVLRTRAERELLQQELLKISEREKHLIARELHDGLCQHLAGTALMGSLLARNLATKGYAEAAEAKKICDLLNTGAVEARNLAHGLHPVKPGDDGLMGALIVYSTTISNLFHIRCSFRCATPVLIESQVIATNFFRIAQEAVSNAIKHGKASRVDIKLARNRRGITLTICDNGTGIAEDPHPSQGMGIQIMHHRADSIGATLKISRAPKGGTVISCLLPST